VTLAEFVYTILLKPRLLHRAANAAIRASLPEHVRVGEAIVWLNPDDPVVSGALALGVYERGEIAFFRSRFGADMTFVDVGANVGLYSAVALSLRMLCDLGFQLYELTGTSGVPAPVASPRALVERTQGRRYANLVGLKGTLATA